jgi:hypothetical protein
MDESVYSLIAQRPDALLGRRIWYVAHPTRKSERKLQYTTTSVQNRNAGCVEAGGGIFENLLKAQINVI